MDHAGHQARIDSIIGQVVKGVAVRCEDPNLPGDRDRGVCLQGDSLCLVAIVSMFSQNEENHLDPDRWILHGFAADTRSDGGYNWFADDLFAFQRVAGESVLIR